MINFLIRKVISILTILLFVTAVMYALVMLAPVEIRASLFIGSAKNSRMTEEQYQKAIDNVIEKYGLNDPFLVQYGRWLGQLVRGNLGFSPSAHVFVAEALITRVPATAELVIYSLLLFIPLGMISGMIAASQQSRGIDWLTRFGAYIASALPPFILALVLLSIFWVGLKWFSIGRLEVSNNLAIHREGFRLFTGLLTIDGFLNGRPDISLDALRHLVLPVITVSLVYWASVTRVTRAAAIEELDKEYITAARGRGLPERSIIWRHALPNVFVPSLNASALSVTSLATSLFVIEYIFLLNGVSSMISTAFQDVPDISLALGFVLFSVTLVLIVMTILDILQAVLDPLIREQSGLQ